MSRDTYLLYAISIATSSASFEFVAVMLQSTVKHIMSGRKSRGACQACIHIARIIYIFFTVIICEYLYVNRTAGMGSFALGCTAIFAIQALFKSNGIITLINTLTRPAVNLLVFIKKMFTVKRKMNGEKSDKNTKK